MLIDFSPLDNPDLKLYDFAQQFSLDDLRAAANASLDNILSIIGSADDAQVAFLPNDPLANDPFAPPEEQHIGWSLAHLVVHVTATAEEGAAYSAILARGIPYPREPRLRYETDWHTMKTRAQVLQRIEESRRIRLAALDTWPDEPHLDVYRDVSEKALERNGASNAKAAFLGGLRHEAGHFAQMRDAAHQACEALAPAGTC
ncbi:MAG TPA: DinB family protein [Phototrophicaceae bacterium]|nr:DinB family protein [Phototrophicaceae bacterium]